MGRIVNNNQRNTGFANNNFLRDVCLGRYVLVLGGDVILKPEYGRGNSTEYILNECRMGLSPNTQNDLVRGQISMKQLVRKMLCENWDYKVDEISDSLVSLLKTRYFPLVLTTSFDGYIEKLMREIYGDELRVMNFFENKGNLEKNEEFGTFVPTLYYVFGKAERNLDFAFNEDDYMRILCKWMDSDKPQGLIDYLRTKKILAIGGKYENWYFRFFWYSLRQSLVPEQREGDVAISLDDIQDERLVNYLQRINVYNHQGQARDFLENLSKKLCHPDQTLYDAIHTANLQKLGGVFISYAHEDYPIACQIYATLVSLGISVWFDTDKLHGGSHYDVRISNAISQCKIFMPILSIHTKMDCTNQNQRYYKDMEWKMVQNNKKCTIMPIALYGFDINEDSHLLPPHFKVTIIDWAADGEAGLEKALKNYI